MKPFSELPIDEAFLTEYYFVKKDGKYVCTQFEDCIKLALVAHRKFLSSRQIADNSIFQEIVKQLNQHNETRNINTLP